MAWKTKTRGRTRGAALIVGLAGISAASMAWAQLSTDTGISSGRGYSVQDRVRKAQEGATIEEMVARLSDADPTERLAAIRGLTQKGGPEAKNYLVESLDDSDPRVQAMAIDGLVRLRAGDTSPALAQRLFLKGVPREVRMRILSALARIGEPATARSILDFARETSDPELRGTALYAIGEIADPSIRPDLQGLADRETDPKTRRVAAEALAKIARRAPPSGAGEAGVENRK
jgi:HEAT repeat protein